MVSKRLVQYLETALWSSTVLLSKEEGSTLASNYDRFDGIEDGDPLDDWFSVDDFTDEALKEAGADLDDWFDHLDEYELYERAAEYKEDTTIAADFWLTRNGHGAGYWDGDYGRELGRLLTDACFGWKGVNILIDCDGRLYFA